MVFSSVPIFLDPPNWQQQQNHHHQANSVNSNIISGHEVLQHHQLPPLPPNPNPNSSNHASAGGSARPGGGSMVERARLAKIPQPEGALNCPRCESTNTKFCYFNNYSLSQPRHFCKTCRRYWTRGGALRNVPVGGGCRRNKKGKNGNSKPSNVQNKQILTGSSSSTTSGTSESVINIGQTNTQFPFLPSLENLSQFANIGLNLSVINNNNQAQIGLNGANNTASLINDLGFLQVGTGANTSGLLSSNNESILSSSVNQFALFDPAIALYPFHGEGNIGVNNIGSSSSSSSMVAGVSQMAPVKMEENHLLNLSRPISGLTSLEDNNNNNPYWAGGSDFSGINSSSNNHIL